MKTFNAKKTRIVLIRCILTLCLAGSVAFIFGNSLDSSSKSTVKGVSTQEIVNQAAEKAGLEQLGLRAVRKMAHLAEFALMGFLLILCLRAYTNRCWKFTGWMLFFGLLTAVTDESLQYLVPGRAPEVRDVVLDFAGFSVGWALAAAILVVAGKLRHKTV